MVLLKIFYFLFGICHFQKIKVNMLESKSLKRKRKLQSLIPQFKTRYSSTVYHQVWIHLMKRPVLPRQSWQILEDRKWEYQSTLPKQRQLKILVTQKVGKLLEATNLSNSQMPVLSSVLTCLLDHEQTAFFFDAPMVNL